MRAGSAADRGAQHVTPAVARQPDRGLGGGDGALRERDRRPVVEPHGERRRVGVGREAQEDEELAARDALAPARRQHLDELRARMPAEAVDRGAPERIGQQHVGGVAQGRERPAHSTQLAHGGDRVAGGARVAVPRRGASPTWPAVASRAATRQARASRPGSSGHGTAARAAPAVRSIKTPATIAARTASPHHEGGLAVKARRGIVRAGGGLITSPPAC